MAGTDLVLFTVRALQTLAAGAIPSPASTPEPTAAPPPTSLSILFLTLTGAARSSALSGGSGGLFCGVVVAVDLALIEELGHKVNGQR